MARPRKLSTEKEIEKLQQEMMQLKKRYDEKAEKLKELNVRQETERKDNLMKAISKSSLTYEDVMDFIKAGGINRKSR